MRASARRGSGGVRKRDRPQQWIAGAEDKSSSAGVEVLYLMQDISSQGPTGPTGPTGPFNNAITPAAPTGPTGSTGPTIARVTGLSGSGPATEWEPDVDLLRDLLREREADLEIKRRLAVIAAEAAKASKPHPAASDIDTRTVAVTFFPNKLAQSQNRIDLTLPQLAEQIRLKTGPSKEKLPWLKLAVFGEKRSERNCLRTNANTQQITGIEVEHDKGEIAFDTAIAVLRTAGLRALITHRPATCPLPRNAGASCCHCRTSSRRTLAVCWSRASTGCLAASLRPKSFNLSLAYLYGSVNGNPAHRVEVIDGDFIDLRSDLDQGAMGKGVSPDRKQAPETTADKLITSADIAVSFKHLDPGKGLGEGIEQPKIDFAAVKAGCAWLRTVHETGGANEPEPLWYQAARCCVYLPNGDKLIHELGNKHEGYTFETTEEKFAHAVRDSESQDLGWPLCKTIKDRKCTHCETCPHLAEGGSPLHLGLQPTPNADAGVTLADFRAYLPDHSYIFTPTGTFWSAAGVNACFRKGASTWLDRKQPVHHLTWAPGHPMLIENQLVVDGGWIERNGVTTFNLYRPPTLKPGDPSKAGPWLELVRKVYPEDAGRLIMKLAHRVQRPQEKINHAMVLGGAPGIGKDTALEPVKRAIGAWNFKETSQQQILGRFNGFLQSVIMRISEVRDLGDFNRYQFYEHTKAYFAAPPDVLRVDEKNIPEHDVMNCTFAILTTNRLTDGIYLPPDDRRHDVMWSKLTKDDFEEDYWKGIWGWYDAGGDSHVAAYLAALDISAFNPKAPPPKTAAFWSIVDANRAPEEGEVADLLDKLGNPDAVTLKQLITAASSSGNIFSGSIHSLAHFLEDRKNRRAVPHRLDGAGYTPVRNDAALSGLWVVDGTRQVVYAKKSIPLREQIEAVRELQRKANEELQHEANEKQQRKADKGGQPQ
jgi:hypothetical protein